MAEFSKTERRAIRLASDALKCALAGDNDRAMRTVQRIDAECGSDGILLAVLGWSDTLIARVPNLTGGPVSLAFQNADTGRIDENADHVPEEIRWAGRMLAARASNDEATWNALIDALPKDPGAVGCHVGGLLLLVALNLKNLLGGAR